MVSKIDNTIILLRMKRMISKIILIVKIKMIKLVKFLTWINYRVIIFRNKNQFLSKLLTKMILFKIK